MSSDLPNSSDYFSAEAIHPREGRDRLLCGLIQAAMKTVGATKGILSLERDYTVMLAAVPSTAEKRTTIYSLLSATSDELPKSLLEEVTRRQEPLLCNDVLEERQNLHSPLSTLKEPYFSDHLPRSLLCLPIQDGEKLMGILYLEHHSTAGIFTPDSVNTIKLLTAQTAIALENARHSAELEDYSRSLEDKVTQSRKELQQEIRDRQLITDRLHASEQKIRAILEGMTDIVLILDTDGNIEAAPTNTSAWYDSELDILSHTIAQFFDDDTAPQWWNQVQYALETQKIHDFDYCLPFGDREFWFSASIAPMSENTAIWVGRDISDRQAAEAALRHKNEELAHTLKELRRTQDELIQSEKMAALGQLVAGVAHEVNTPLGAIRSSIENIADFLDRKLDRLPSFFQNLSPERYQDFFTLLHKSAQQPSTLSSREKRKIKRQFIAQLEDCNIADSDVVADLLVDMGVYEALEAFLPLLQDADSDRILDMAYQLASVQKSTQTIATATEKAAKVVFALKTYARYDHSGEKVEANIVDGVETVLTLYHNQLKQGIEVLRNYAPGLPRLRCYPDELNQVWTNLIYNAIQAMDNKGTLEVEVTEQDRGIQVSMTDSGKGIPPEVQDKIFQPFFTTKPAGEGSGLGLDIVRKIIAKHGGTIEFASVPGKTTFSVLLPIDSH